jgi:hypothetical protein
MHLIPGCCFVPIKLNIIKSIIYDTFNDRICCILQITEYTTCCFSVYYMIFLLNLSLLSLLLHCCTATLQPCPLRRSFQSKIKPAPPAYFAFNAYFTGLCFNKIFRDSKSKPGSGLLYGCAGYFEIPFKYPG